jgi:hypothetical protein
MIFSFMNCSNGFTSSAKLRPYWLAGIAGDINDGAILVKRSALAASGPARNVLYFFGGQLAGAHTIQHPVQRALLLFKVK